MCKKRRWLLKQRGAIQITGPSRGPVIGVFVFLARSRELRRSFGTRGTGAVSIASCEALDARIRELLLDGVSGLAWSDGALKPDDPGVAGACSGVGRADATGAATAASALPWLLPELAEAAGTEKLIGGRAALAAPTIGACGFGLDKLGLVRATAMGRCGAAPCCTTSAKDLFVKDSETASRASRKLMLCVNLTVNISFSFFQAGHEREYAG